MMDCQDYDNMDYKYIEQLLERYFQCETTLKEEEILRMFFSQEDVPVWLAKYQPLFGYEAQQDEPLGEEFDARILALTEEQRTVHRLFPEDRRYVPAPW